ncbi:uncharacterized protein LOC108665346 [Hyalella azteca]|uniref:Uncharacterized protein LOC108665346 n=1 Tax=Hyalella azteca TaxID=294128 RepID=A0A8B7N1Z0_HYAAZ|nr:uncharacterized protein LOC108665346 [Hyalella azteca]
MPSFGGLADVKTVVCWGLAVVFFTALIILPRNIDPVLFISIATLAAFFSVSAIVLVILHLKVFDLCRDKIKNGNFSLIFSRSATAIDDPKELDVYPFESACEHQRHSFPHQQQNLQVVRDAESRRPSSRTSEGAALLETNVPKKGTKPATFSETCVVNKKLPGLRGAAEQDETNVPKKGTKPATFSETCVVNKKLPGLRSAAEQDETDGTDTLLDNTSNIPLGYYRGCSAHEINKRSKITEDLVEYSSQADGNTRDVVETASSSRQVSTVGDAASGDSCSGQKKRVKKTVQFEKRESKYVANLLNTFIHPKTPVERIYY